MIISCSHSTAFQNSTNESNSEPAAGLAFGLAPTIGWDQLTALWTGMSIGLVLSCFGVFFIIYRLDWTKLAEKVAAEQEAVAAALIAESDGDAFREELREEDSLDDGLRARLLP